jgi:N-acyl homoserine lactone hydrolase
MLPPVSRLLGALAIAALTAASAAAQTPTVTVSRLDCGTSAPPSDVGRFSDTYALNGLKVQLVFSCYLVRHGDDYMVWDTGQPATAGASAPKVALVDLLGQAGVTPQQVKFVGISHYHGDHTGQASQLPGSTLLIGKGDWDIVSDAKAPAATSKPFMPWIIGGGKYEAVVGDKDVFGDGTVVMLNTPGHTPGHHSLLVRSTQLGNLLLTGDAAHFHENYDANGVPTFNSDRAQTLASLARFKAIAANLKATVIIQHDARDVSKVPALTATAR